MATAVVWAWALAVSGSAHARAEPPRLPRLPPAPRWQAPVPDERRLPSGLRVAVAPRHELPLVHLLAVVRAGTATGAPGLAAATAAMLDEGGAGGRGGGELAEAFDALGGSLETECDVDSVRLEITVGSDDVGRALALLSDVLARPRFDDADWQRVRSLRLAQILKDRDEPRKVADQAFARAVYGEHHPYGAPLDGSAADLAHFTVDALRRFHAARYGPRTTALLFAGDIEPARAFELATAALGDWDAAARPVEIAPPAGEIEPARVLLIDRPGAPQSELMVGHLGPRRGDPMLAPAILLQTVLGGSFTSRLVQNLRERHGYTYQVSARFDALAASGSLAVDAAVRTDATAAAVGEIVSELRAIRRPVSPAELERARALVTGGLVAGFAGGDGVLRFVGDLLAYDMPLDTWRRLPAKLAAIGRAPLAAAASRLLRPDALTIIIVGDRRAIEPGLRALRGLGPIEVREVQERAPADEAPARP